MVALHARHVTNQAGQKQASSLQLLQGKLPVAQDSIDLITASPAAHVPPVQQQLWIALLCMQSLQVMYMRSCKQGTYGQCH